MVTPADIFGAAKTFEDKCLADIEAEMDKNIVYAISEHNPSAHVHTGGYTQGVQNRIEEVAAKYRAAGWSAKYTQYPSGGLLTVVFSNLLSPS